MLMRGTRNKSRQEIQDELARLQSQLNVGGGAGLASANIQSTRENLPDVLALAIEVLREPAFPEAELTTLKEQIITNLESSRSEPQAIVSRAYAPPLGAQLSRATTRATCATIDEELAFVNGVTVAKLRDFHEDFFGASHAEVVVIGDFDPERGPRAARPSGSTVGAARSRSATC